MNLSSIVISVCIKSEYIPAPINIAGSTAYLIPADSAPTIVGKPATENTNAAAVSVPSEFNRPSI